MNWISGIKKLMHSKDQTEQGEVSPYIVVPEEEDESTQAGEPPTKESIIEATCYYTCSKVCYGVKGQAGICCTLGDRDYIIGPINDVERFLEDLSKKLGRTVAYSEVFIDFEEGSKLFPNKTMWQNPNNFPSMRVIADEELGNPCVFLSKNKKCSVHSIKPMVCSNYLCSYLGKVVDLLEVSLDPPEDFIDEETGEVQHPIDPVLAAMERAQEELASEGAMGSAVASEGAMGSPVVSEAAAESAVVSEATTESAIVSEPESNPEQAENG